MLEFVIIGKPVPYVRMTQRGKFVRRDAQRYLDSKTAIGLQLVRAMSGRAPLGRRPLMVKLAFCYQGGADHRRDLDNEVKAILDAANGIVYEDDRWIDSIEALRTTARDGAGNYVWLRVEEL